MKRVLLSAALGLGLVTLAAPAFADLALATSKNCMSCHAVERKVLGPSFKDVAAKYKDDKGAVDTAGQQDHRRAAPACGDRCRCRRTTRSAKPTPKKLAAWVLSTK